MYFCSAKTERTRRGCLLREHALHEKVARLYLSNGFRRSPIGNLTLVLSLEEMKAN
jgi:hypothetical protein